MSDASTIVLEDEPVVMGGRLWTATRALRHRDYRFFFTAALLANMGGWLAGMARGYYTYEVTGSAALLGTMAFFQTVPILVLIPFAGVLVDRLPRKPLLISTQTVFVLTSAATAILLATHTLQIWHLMLIAVIDGLASAFNAPAWQSLTVELVGPDDLMNAVALNSIQFNVGRILGGLASGVLYDLLGAKWCFGLDSLFLLAGIASLAQVRMRPPSLKAARTGPYLNFVAGTRYLKRHADLIALVCMSASVTVFALPYLMMLPVFARTILHGTARTQSYLLAAVGIGALMAAFLQAIERDDSGRGRLMLWSQVVLATCIGIFAQSQHLPLSLVALVGCGAAMVGFATTANTTMQLLVPDHMRGRLMGVFLLAAFGLTPIGALLMGFIAQKASAPTALTAGAVACGALAIFVAIRFPRVRTI